MISVLIESSVAAEVVYVISKLVFLLSFINSKSSVPERELRSLVSEAWTGISFFWLMI